MSKKLKERPSRDGLEVKMVSDKMADRAGHRKMRGEGNVYTRRQNYNILEEIIIIISKNVDSQ